MCVCIKFLESLQHSGIERRKHLPLSCGPNTQFLSQYQHGWRLRPSSSCWQNLASSESPRPRQSFPNLLSTLALQKAGVTHLIQALRRPRQRIAMNLRPALVYSVRPCLKTNKKNTKASSLNSWICPFSQLERPPIQKLSSEPLFNYTAASLSFQGSMN